MESKIAHRRLYAFYRSKALSSMAIAVFLGIMLAHHLQSLFPLICTAAAGAFLVGYSLWIWIARPRTIVICDWLSNVSGLYFIYFLMFRAVDHLSPWWSIGPVLAGIVVLFISSLNAGDENFEV